jgi:hypothetical protein
MGHLQTRKNLSKQGKTFPNKENPFQTRKNTSKQGKTFPNKKKHQQTRETPFEQGKRLSSKGYLPIKCKSLQVVGVSRQGKAVVSDGGYGVIGGGYCLLVWGDAEGTKGKRGRRWRGVGPAGRPSLFPFGGSIILKSDIDMTREEARNVFGGSIVNELLSLGAEPTNVVRQDGLIEWKSDGYIEVGGVQVWAYYYFEDGEDVDRCDWADHMEIEIEECWI